MRYRTIARDLDFVASRIGLPISRRNHFFTAEDGALIAFARTALEYGEAVQDWEWVELPVTQAQARTMLDEFAGGVVRSLSLSSEEGEFFALFNVVLPLGPTEILLPQAKLINEQQVRQELARRGAADEVVILRFGTADITTVIFRYPNWLPSGKWHQGVTRPPVDKRPGDHHSIERNFPGRWLIRISTHRMALVDLLGDSVALALEQLDREDRERVLRALPIVLHLENERTAEWTAEKLPSEGDFELLKLSEDVGLIVQRRSDGSMDIVEIVRPKHLRAYARG